MKLTAEKDESFVAYQRRKRAEADDNLRLMELAHNLLLNETALAALSEHKRPVFVYEWLRFLDKILPAAQKSDIQRCQQQLVSQLLDQLSCSPTAATRQLLASCLATVFSVADASELFNTVDHCTDIIRKRDDSPKYIACKLAAVCCLGCMYERLGRMMGRSYESVVQLLTKNIRSYEWSMRCQVMCTLGQLCRCMGTAGVAVHRDIYKAARHCITDRVMRVRAAAATCVYEMLEAAVFLHATSELDSVVSLCLRALDGADCDARRAVARLLGSLLAHTQMTPPASFTAVKGQTGRANTRTLSVDEALAVLMNGFTRGGSGFLKGTGEMIKGTPTVSREVRVGVTMAYGVFVESLGSLWLERHLSTFINHVLHLSSHPRSSVTHVDTVYVRKCVLYILHVTLGRMLGEPAQMAACKELVAFVTRQVSTEAVLEGGGTVPSRDISSSSCSPGSATPSPTLSSSSTTLSSSSSSDPGVSSGSPSRHHAVVCALLQLGALTHTLGTSANCLITDSSVNLLECVMCVLIHPHSCARYAAAWCLRSSCLAVPATLTGCIDRCLERVASMRHSAEAVAGYCAALAALLGAVRHTPLGTPHDCGRRVFCVGEELLRAAAHNSRLSLARTHSGWLLLASVASMGLHVVRALLPRMMLLWRNSFPRSSKELDSEKSRGDAFTWQVSLEGRAGALSCIHSVLLHCPELLTEDLTRRLMVPLNSAITMLSSLTSVVKSYGQHLKASLAMCRLRLYEVLCLLPCSALEESQTSVFRLLVSELTLVDSGSTCTSTSLLRPLCHVADDSALLDNTKHQRPELRSIEQQLETNSASGSGALEHDITYLFSRKHACEGVPGPMPLGVAIIDQAVVLFGQLLPRAANKHRTQMLNHFSDCIKQAKGLRQEVVQTNVFAALLSGLRGVLDAKCNIGDENVITPATQLIVGSLTGSNALLRLAAAEALGRLGQAVNDPRFVAEMAQLSFDKLKSTRDVITRTGHSVALGCLYRYVGSMMGGSHQLATSISILLALAHDNSSQTVQVWSLHALSMMTDAGGPMFRSYVEPILSLCLRVLLLPVCSSQSGSSSGGGSVGQLARCVAQCVSALINTVGPELQGNSSSISGTRSSLLCACAVLLAHPACDVKASAICCLQQLHLFAPRQLNLATLVPMLCRSLDSSELVVIRAAVACLRQLSQRDAVQVHNLSTTVTSVHSLTGTGLAGLLFSLLDTETDHVLVSHVHDTLVSMSSALLPHMLVMWLRLCKHVLTTSVDASTEIHSVGGDCGEAAGLTVIQRGELSAGDESVCVSATDLPDTEEEDDDMQQFSTGQQADCNTHPPLPPRCSTRVFAAELLLKVMQCCRADVTHFDATAAKQARFVNPNSEWLVLHLSELVRMSFMAATSNCDDRLRLAGLACLHHVITAFSHTADPLLPGCRLLQQYQAQVSAALRPAFSSDTACHVTASACQVCSAWICSGVARDMSDVRRVHQLLVCSLNKLQENNTDDHHNNNNNITGVYNEAANSLAKLAIMKAWAQVYVSAVTQCQSTSAAQNDSHRSSASDRDDQDQDDEDGEDHEGLGGDELLSLVQPHLATLAQLWLAALKDQAILCLPEEYSRAGHVMRGGTFFTGDTAEASRAHFRLAWPTLLHATALWVHKQHSHIQCEGAVSSGDEHGGDIEQTVSVDTETGHTECASTEHTENKHQDTFYLILGLCMRALCDPRGGHSSEEVLLCVEAVGRMLSCGWGSRLLTGPLQVELLACLRRLLLLQCDSVSSHRRMSVMHVVCLTASSALYHLQVLRSRHQSPPSSSAHESGAGGTVKSDSGEMDIVGEGGAFGDIIVASSTVMALMQCVYAVMSRVVPCVTETQPTTCPARPASITVSVGDSSVLLCQCMRVLRACVDLCSARGAVTLLPAVLHLCSSTVHWLTGNTPSSSSSSEQQTEVVTEVVSTLRHIVCHRFGEDERSSSQWSECCQSCWARILQISDDTGRSHDPHADAILCHVIHVFVQHVARVGGTCSELSSASLVFIRQCLLSPCLTLRLQCCRLIDAIFSLSSSDNDDDDDDDVEEDRLEGGSVWPAYVIQMAPVLLQQLHCSRSPLQQVELQVLQQQLSCVQSLLAACQHHNRGEMLSLLLCVMARHLLQSGDQLMTASHHTQLLHQHCVHVLNTVAPLYSQEFKLLLGDSVCLRARIEGALSASHKLHQQQQLLRRRHEQNHRLQHASTSLHPPPLSSTTSSITLTTDFSKFTL